MLPQQARIWGNKWCKDVRIHFFAGGAEGDGFAGIVQAGAENAIRDTGADAENTFTQSGNLTE